MSVWCREGSIFECIVYVGGVYLSVWCREGGESI